MADFERVQEEKRRAAEEDKKVKSFEQMYFEMSETKQKNMRIGGAGGYGGALEDELGLPKPSPKIGEAKSTTPRGGSTTPRGVKSGLSTTPRGAAKANMPTTPTKTPTKDGKFTFDFASIFANDEMPADEFKDYFSNLDSDLPKEP